MSTLHNGLISEDMVKNVFDALKENTLLSRHGKMENFPNKKEQDSDHRSTVMNNTNHLDPNRDDQPSTYVTVPETSLPFQIAGCYSDVRPSVNEHDHPQESSDSIHTQEGGSKGEVINIKPNLPHQFSLKQNGGESRVDSNPYGNASRESVAALSEFSNAQRPESLSLPKPIQTIEQEQNKLHSVNKNHTNDNGLNGNNLSQNVTQPINIQDQGAHFIDESSSLSNSLPHGTIMRNGDMIQFVADDLQEKIKQSSPMSFVADTVGTNSRRSSVRSTASFSSSTSFATSSGVSRSPSSQFQQSPDDIPPIDATAVIELENHARRVADNLDLMMGNIRNNLHKMSAITIGCQDAYKRSVDITCDSVDASIKSMYALMAKCEELSASMGPVEQLATQIKEIKRILDLFETQLIDK